MPALGRQDCLSTGEHTFSTAAVSESSPEAEHFQRIGEFADGLRIVKEVTREEAEGIGNALASPESDPLIVHLSEWGQNIAHRRAHFEANDYCGGDVDCS